MNLPRKSVSTLVRNLGAAAILGSTALSPAAAQEVNHDMMRTAVEVAEGLGTAPGLWFDEIVMGMPNPVYSNRSMVGGPSGTFVETEQRMLRYSLNTGICMASGRPHIWSTGEMDTQNFSQLYDGDYGWQRDSFYNNDDRETYRFRIMMPVDFTFDNGSISMRPAGEAKVIARTPVYDMLNQWEDDINSAMRRARSYSAGLGSAAQSYASESRAEFQAAFIEVLPGC